ncbi:MAG TPA: ABC transporter permease [Anaeromyxobacter sp.]|nr:ABC transporter permease [Anaeromyxobacter sp.]
MDATASAGGRSLGASLLRTKESAILLALLIMMVVIGVIAPRFISGTNLFQVSRQVAFVAIVALGELFVILTGGIDLSVGSIMGWSGVAAAWAMSLGVNPALAVLFGILAGVAMGAINGSLIAFVKVPPFIATLGMLQFAHGNVLGLTKGWPITAIPKSFLWVAQGDFLFVPVPVWIGLVIAVIAHVVLTYTAFGRRTYAIGGNEQATFLSGIDVDRIKFALYMISSACAAVSGIILVSRFSSAQPDTGTGWELDAIAAAVIGGTSLAGGSGSVLGVVIGACIMAVLRNGLVLMRVSPYWHISIIGVVIVLAAVLDVKTKRT